VKGDPGSVTFTTGGGDENPSDITTAVVKRKGEEERAIGRVGLKEAAFAEFLDKESTRNVPNMWSGRGVAGKNGKQNEGGTGGNKKTLRKVVWGLSNFTTSKKGLGCSS